ncbi:MAG: nucleotidyltransferase family protein [bacterium]|nr:nucleotidyltransferase family protein [bacterium]
MNQNQAYMISLLKSAITNTEALVMTEGIDWAAFAEYAETQQFEHIIYPLLKDKDISGIDPQVWHHLHQRYGRAVYRDSIQDMELEEICTIFTENQIAHIPMKGSVVKRYYPLPDIRRSTDFDILVHNEDRYKATTILKELGYIHKLKNQTMHDTFFREKTYLELHVMLVSPETKAYQFFKNVWDYVLPDNGYTYKMQPEFLYTHLLAHLHRHLMAGGGGIKLISDFRILNHSVQLDHERLIEFAEKAGMIHLYECVNELAAKWFDDVPCQNPYTLMIEKLLLSGGAYGDYETSMKMRFSKKNGNGNIFQRLFCFAFPSAKYLTIRYPVLEKHPQLLPIMWAKRLLDFKGYNPKLIFGAARKSEDEKMLADFCEYVSE